MKTTILSFVSLFFIICQIQAQVAEPGNFFFGMEPVEEITMDDMDPEAEPDLTGIDHKIIVYLTLVDTISISNIHIRLGTSAGGTELFDGFFTFDNYELDEGQEYIREENNLRITIGIFEWDPALYAEVKLEDVNGQFSETVTHTTN